MNSALQILQVSYQSIFFYLFVSYSLSAFIPRVDEMGDAPAMLQSGDALPDIAAENDFSDALPDIAAQIEPVGKRYELTVENYSIH